jgi:ElaB/YqjD/DUF883 family membrane-anchored ribosome-binding protein
MNTPSSPPAIPSALPEIAADAANAATKACNVCKSTAARMERCVQQHPGATLLAAAGFGIIAMLTVRALTPPPPRHRAAQLLEDIQQRLSELADSGAQSVSRGVDQLGDLHLDRKLGRLSHGIKNLFH